MPKNKTLKEIEKAFAFTLPRMRKFIKDFHMDMQKGLSGRRSSLKMIPEYLKRPSGKEKGSFVALDLGGTNFRVLSIKLKGARLTGKPVTRKYKLEKKHIKKTGKELFDFIADCIKNFLKENKISLNKENNIGFTFSFPVRKKGPASGVLIHWTKGFEATGVAGKDVVLLLNRSLEKKGLMNTRVTALANDTVSTLVAKSYKDPHCDVGVILGTGTNACYPERFSNVKKLKKRKNLSGEMIINIEWGNFNRIPLSSYDVKLDKATWNPKEQILEKMVSGMYLGELTRLVIEDLEASKIIFKTHHRTIFNKPGAFRTEYMSLAEKDDSETLAGINKLLRRMKIKKSTYEERKLLKYVCRLVSTRAARISAAAMASVITRMDPAVSRPHTVAIDGSVYEKHPGFSKRIRTALKEIFKNKEKNIRISLTKDASSKGAAILAAANST